MSHHPVDEIFILRAHIRELKVRERALRDAIIADHDFGGLVYIASVVDHKSIRVDGAGLRKAFPEVKWLAPFLFTQRTRALVVRERECW